MLVLIAMSSLPPPVDDVTAAEDSSEGFDMTFLRHAVSSALTTRLTRRLKRILLQMTRVGNSMTTRGEERAERFVMF